MPEQSNVPLIIQHSNPNPTEQPDIDVKSLLPSVETIFSKVREEEMPNSQKSEPHILLPDTQVKEIIEDSILEARRIEEAARNSNRWDIPKDLAENMVLVVDFSAPGTYYQPKKEDKYKNFKWSWGMDRQRVDTSAILGIHLAGLSTGNDFSEFTEETLLDGMDPELNNKRDLVRQALHEKNMRFLYLGTEEEGKAIKRVIQTSSSFIPSDLVDVIDKTTNTVDQVMALRSYLASNMKTVNNRTGFITPGSNIIIPIGIQAVRAFPMLKQFDAIPEGLRVFLFPIAAPAEGIGEYTTLETKGRVYYTLTGKAARQPIHHTLLGEK